MKDWVTSAAGAVGSVFDADRQPALVCGDYVSAQYSRTENRIDSHGAHPDSGLLEQELYPNIFCPKYSRRCQQKLV